MSEIGSNRLTGLALNGIRTLSYILTDMHVAGVMIICASVHGILRK